MAGGTEVGLARAASDRRGTHPASGGGPPTILFAKYDHFLDTHQHLRWLAEPRIAAMVRANLYHHNGSKYHLLAYCIMPNHVHLLLQPLTAAQWLVERAPAEALDRDEQPDRHSPLTAVMHSLKSYTAHQANQMLRRRGPFWQHESYDHWVRDEAELERIVDYIAANPVKANLVTRPHDWYFCSAHDRYLQDGSAETFLRGPDEMVWKSPTPVPMYPSHAGEV